MAFKTVSKKFEITSRGPYPNIVDITDDAKIIVKQSGVIEGIVVVQIFHTTGSIFINEDESCLWEDILNTLKRLVPPEGQGIQYKHNDIGGARTKNVCDDECANGDAHIKALLIGTTAVLDVAVGDISLGEWQKILLFNGDRDYKVKVRVLGDDGT